jgi:putative acetyltransferase
MQIRPEEPRDFDAIDRIVHDAFTSDGRDGTPEQDLVRRLRSSDGYVPELALVAVEGDEVVGHIMFTYVHLGPRRVLQLAPLAVRPDKQNAKVGDVLSREGIVRADAKGEPLICVLGHPNYYPRFGFEPGKALGIEAPDDGMDPAWMVCKLSSYDPSMTGRVRFSAAFGGT